MTHFHRTSRTTSLDWVRARDAVAAVDLADRVAHEEVIVETETFGRLAVLHLGTASCGRWSRHVWSRFEGDFVIAETVIEDGSARCTALGIDFCAEADRLASRAAIHVSLGELRAGRGQCAAEGKALLPPGLPAAICPIADAMHHVWNGRSFDALDPLWAEDVAWSGPDGQRGNRRALAGWIARLIGKFDDAILLFEDAVVAGDRAALLWRLHGHQSAEAFGVTPRGARIRLIGSSVFQFVDGRIVEDETLIDTLAAAVQLRSKTIVY